MSKVDSLRDLPMALRGSTTVHYGLVQFHLNRGDGRLYAMKDGALYIQSPTQGVERAALDIISNMTRDNLL